MLMTARRALLSLVVAASIALAGCAHGGSGLEGLAIHVGGGSARPDVGPSCVREAPSPLAAEAPPDAAVVVFVRPSFIGSAVSTTIVDREGNLVARLLSSSHFAVTLPPGDHVLVARTNDDVVALRATLAPGKRYYVEVGFGFAFDGFSMRFTAVKPGSDAWKKVPAWLADTRPLVRDPAEDWSRCGRRGEDGEARIQGAIRALAKLDGAELADHTLQPEDGR